MGNQNATRDPKNLLERDQIASCLGKAGSTRFLEPFKPHLQTQWPPSPSPQHSSCSTLPCYSPDLSYSECSQREGGSGKQASSLLGPGLLAMPWTFRPTWLVGKGLPLLGAVLLQKRENRGPHWRQRRVMYSSHLRVLTTESWGMVPCRD